MTDRNRQLAQIHIARAQLGLDDETYRAMLWTIGRVQSAAKLDHAGRAAVLDHLKARGFRARRAKRPTPAADRAGMVGKVRALLIAAGNRPDAYADGVAQRMFHVQRFEWLRPDQLRRLIAALTIDIRRHGG